VNEEVEEQVEQGAITEDRVLLMLKGVGITPQIAELSEAPDEGVWCFWVRDQHRNWFLVVRGVNSRAGLQIIGKKLPKKGGTIAKLVVMSEKKLVEVGVFGKDTSAFSLLMAHEHERPFVHVILDRRLFERKSGILVPSWDGKCSWRLTFEELKTFFCHYANACYEVKMPNFSR